MPYAELQVTTNYSFLRSGSHPGELVCQAASLGHYAIGITDRNTLAGVVRAYSAIKDYYEEARAASLPRKSGSSCWSARDRDPRRLFAARLSDERRRLQAPVAPAEPGNSDAAKGECDLTFEDLAEYADDILAIVLPPRKHRRSGFP